MFYKHFFLLVFIFCLFLSFKCSKHTVNPVNTAPTANFTVIPDSGGTGTIYNFDASSCNDEDDISQLQMKWDWEDDGTWDTNYSTNNKVISHQYNTLGIYTVRLSVKDTEDLEDDTTKQVKVSSFTMLDIDGNEYQIVKIGIQWWMAENLRVTHYRNGDPILNVISDSEWKDLKYSSTGAYCAYNNNENNTVIYEYLYNWYSVNDNRNIAPEGWHVPTDEEWKELEMYLGMDQLCVDSTRYRGTNEGGKLKETGTTHWESPNTGATNESGFSALPGGYRNDSDGSFYSMSEVARYWTSSAYNFGAWSRYLGFNYSNIGRFSQNNKVIGFSVRLIKD